MDEQKQRSESEWPEATPGWYVRHDEFNSIGYFDGKDFTGPTMPAEVRVSTTQLIQGVAWGVVVGSFITGAIFTVVILLAR